MPIPTSITQQIEHSNKLARAFLKRLIKDIPEEQWFEIPKGHYSNIAWQVGHIILTQNYNSITVVVGLHPEAKKIVNFREFVPLYTAGSDPKNVTPEVTSREKLLEQLDAMGELTNRILRELPEEELAKPLLEFGLRHPFAKTKYEALSWTSQHEMWHCGQIASLKNFLGTPFRIGPKKI